MKQSKLLKNTLLLYIMTAAKLILPLVTLPYLTRVLTSDSYGVVVYVKSIMTYVQIIIEFGFMLSATKDIVHVINRNENYKCEVGRITGDVFAAQFVLSLISAIFVYILSVFIPIANENQQFIWLYFISYVINILLADFLFRGLEKMEMVSIPFVIAKIITTSLTFVFVKNDSTMIFIPILEIIGNSVAVIFTTIYRRYMGIKLSFSNWRQWIAKIKESFLYFLSNFSSTAFGALNTMMVGILLTKKEIAYWGIVMQLVSAVQQMYQPIYNSLYPYMIKTKSRKLIKNTLILLLPVVVIGCIFCFFSAKYIILIIGGEQYLETIPLFKSMIPLMFISFLAMLYGWPVLGAIYKTAEITFSTVMASLVQIGLIILVCFINRFSLYTLVLCRIISEIVMLGIRYYYYKKFRYEFAD